MSRFELELTNEQSDMALNEDKIRFAVEKILDFLGIETDEMGLHFVSDERLCELHKDFFDDPSSTDCITFPMDGGDEAMEGVPHVLGEVFVCPLTAMSYVAEEGGDPYEELLLYVVHGILHLIGYDDIEEDDRKEMKREEARVMEHLTSVGLSIAPIDMS